MAACGVRQGSADAAKSVSAAISGGEADSVDSNVFFMISHREENGQSVGAECSASLIAPNLLLTARHCVADVTSEQVMCGVTTAGDPFPANTFFAVNAQDTGSANEITKSNLFTVSSIAVPTESTDICGFDLALVTLSTLVPASLATPLIPRIDRPVTKGEVYTAVGYGQDSPGDAGIDSARGASRTKRARRGLRAGDLRYRRRGR